MHGDHRHAVALGELADRGDVLAHAIAPHHQLDGVVAQLGGQLEPGGDRLGVHRGRGEGDGRALLGPHRAHRPNSTRIAGETVSKRPTSTANRVVRRSSLCMSARTTSTSPTVTSTAAASATTGRSRQRKRNPTQSAAPPIAPAIHCATTAAHACPAEEPAERTLRLGGQARRVVVGVVGLPVEVADAIGFAPEVVGVVVLVVVVVEVEGGGAVGRAGRRSRRPGGRCGRGASLRRPRGRGPPRWRGRRRRPRAAGGRSGRSGRGRASWCGRCGGAAPRGVGGRPMRWVASASDAASGLPPGPARDRSTRRRR